MDIECGFRLWKVDLGVLWWIIEAGIGFKGLVDFEGGFIDPKKWNKIPRDVYFFVRDGFMGLTGGL